MDAYFKNLFNELSKVKAELDNKHPKEDYYKLVANNYNRMAKDEEPDSKELYELKTFFGNCNNTAQHTELINAIIDYLNKLREEEEKRERKH